MIMIIIYIYIYKYIYVYICIFSILSSYKKEGFVLRDFVQIDSPSPPTSSGWRSVGVRGSDVPSCQECQHVTRHGANGWAGEGWNLEGMESWWVVFVFTSHYCSLPVSSYCSLCSIVVMLKLLHVWIMHAYLDILRSSLRSFSWSAEAASFSSTLSSLWL